MNTARPTRRRLTCTLTALALLTTPALIAAPGAAIASPQTPRVAPAPALPAPAAVPLAGTDNTRDFSAYRTADGHSIKKLVIRSDNLSKVTPADVGALKRRGVTEIIDFRTQLERAAQPDRPIPGATVRIYDVLGGTPVTNLADLPSAYRAFVTDPGARQSFRRTLLDIGATASRGDTLLFHCTAGKDRTGWASAVLLSILGVDRGTVERDFLASNTFRHTTASDPINGVNIAWLRSSFATADRVYGSFDGYLRQGLGLTETDISALRTSLLEP